MTFHDNWHIKAVCDHLEAVAEGRIKKLLINVPPGTMKSLLVCVFWPAWVWTTRPSKRFLFASYSDALTMRDSVRCRTLLASRWYQNRWPLKFKQDQNTKGLFENVKEGWRMATSVGGKGTGLHPDFIVADDPNNAREAESEVERQAVIDWWDGTISSRGVSRDVAQIVIQQRLNVMDLTGHLLPKGTWNDHLCLPMRYEVNHPYPCKSTIGFKDPRTQDGELLWPNLFTEEKVDGMSKDMGIYHCAGQLQQRPSPRGGGMFKREWFNDRVSAVPNDLMQIVRYWDKAGTAGGDGARSAGVLIGKRQSGKFVILDVIKGRWGATEREATIKSTARDDALKFGHKVITWVEQEPGSGGKESAENTVKNLVGFTCRIERVTGAKVVRAEPFAAQCSVNNVQLLESAWNEEFVSEAEMFPAGALKDQVDAAGGGFNKVNTGTGAWGGDALRQAAEEESDGMNFPDLEIDLEAT